MWRASRFLLGVELALDATKGGGAYSFLQASFFRMTSWQHIFTEMLGFLAGRFLFLTVGSRDDNRWRVRRARAVSGGTTVGVSNASAAETPASYPLLFMPGRRQAGHFPLAALPRRLARVSFGQSGAFLNRENPQLGSRVLRPRLCTAGPFLKRHRFRKESDSVAESPNSQSRRHLVVSARGAVYGRKAHRHVDGGQLRGLHAGAVGRCTTWPTASHARLAGAGLSHAGEH